MPIPDKIRIKQLDVELNGGCNFKCQMCPQSVGRETAFLKKMPIPVLEKVIDDALQYGVEAVSLHGSGEPTLDTQMPVAVKAIKSRGIKCISFTNGYKLDANLSRDLIHAGIDILRVSAIGYDRESYHKWMNIDAYDTVRENVKRFCQLNLDMGGTSELHLYHLITDFNNVSGEKSAYQTNWINYTGALSEIWLMHNWSGGYVSPYSRANMVDVPLRRSCGRPFSEVLQVRAGGNMDHAAAVVACCMVLGQDSSAVLGHLDTQTIEEVVKGEPFRELRLAHSERRFDDVSYCKDCDQLFELPTSLVWTNIPKRIYGGSKIVGDLDHRKFSNILKTTG